MNKQGRSGIEWTHVFGEGTGYTWNVSQGCLHGCEWKMPDGKLAQCYAKTIADKFRSPSFMPGGFERHYFHPDRLDEPLKLKSPAGIFLDSFSDLIGHWTSDEQIQQVLDICRRTPQHVYFLLTKNPPRLCRFDFPPNVWVGVSMPPSRMMGKDLTLGQQAKWFYVAMTSLARCNAAVKWVSFEPLSFDIADVMSGEGWDNLCRVINWAVIGAASNSAKVYQPQSQWIGDLLDLLDCAVGCPVFFKGNLHGNLACTVWREEFPQVQSVKQLSMF